jgi:cytochrome P450/NADPH-cytochrome P450 reductase
METVETTEIPHIKPLAVVRMARSMKDATLLELAMAATRQYGPILQMPGSGTRQIIVSSFPLVDELCDEKRFDKALGSGLRERRAVAGDGLFTSYTQEPNWHKAHNILLPTFSRQAMKSYVPEMLDLASQLMLKWQRLNDGDIVDVPQDMTRLTMDTIGLCGFDYRFNSFYRTDQHPFVAAMMAELAKSTERMASQAGGGDHPLASALLGAITNWLRPSAEDEDPLDHPDSGDAETRHNRAVMNSLVDEIIQARKAQGPEAIAAEHDLLSYMLTGVDKQSGERLDDRTIRYEILTFLVAGHETTSGLLSFMLYFLSKHPEVRARAYDEVDQVLGTDLSVQPTYEQIHRLTYVNQLLKETLRLWPTAPLFSRYPYQETTLGGKYTVKPDDIISILTPMLHRDTSIWGSDAEEFNPDHFSPEAERTHPTNAYKPFGSGQRACIGREFAIQEAMLVTGMILQRFELVDYANYELHLKQTLTIKPADFTLKLRPRAHRTITVPAPTTLGVSTPSATDGKAAEAATIAKDGAGHNTPLLVLFGSNLGTAEDLAHQIANGGAAHSFTATVDSLDDYTDKLPKEGAVVIVTSSYNGTPPDNAAKFCAWLQSETLAKDALRGVRYAVFGCGNHEWTATYQAIPRLVDEQLAAHGAERVCPRGEGDVAGDFDDDVRTWMRPLWERLGQSLSLETAAVGAASPTAALGSLYMVERVCAPVNPTVIANGVRPLTIRANRELQHANGSPQPARSTRHIEVLLPEGVTYRTGDHLGVLPRNGQALLQRVLSRFNMAGDTYVRIHRQGNGTPALPLDQPIAVIDLLSRYVELQEVASRAQISALAEYTQDPAEQAQLAALAEDARYQQEILPKRITVLDLLERFPSCSLPFNAFLELLHPLRVRYYSISSSPLTNARTASVTVAVVNAPARSGQGTYQGICSTYLAHHPEDSVIDGFVHQPHMPFRPPEDATRPIIMIGPGTGLAPFRGFLQERAAQKAKGEPLGPALLFFGCRHPDQDFLYKDELENYAKQGIVTLYACYSRLEDQPKAYVQDVIRAHADEVWQLIQQGAVIYICGDGGKMEPAVRSTLEAICHEHDDGSTGANMGAQQEQQEWIVGLRSQQRYLADVWANG